MPIHFEVFSDIACPWCYIGKRRFERALEGFGHSDEVDVVWRSFQLNPEAPPRAEGSYRDLLGRKYGRSEAEAEQMLDGMTELGAAEGLELRFDLVQPANTFDAHRLVHLGAELGRQGLVKERLMRAYLCEGRLISEHDTLRELAAEVELPAELTDELLGSRMFAERVEAERELAIGFGIRGVPFFAVERQLGSAGAQPVATMRELLEESWRRFGADEA